MTRDLVRAAVVMSPQSNAAGRARRSLDSKDRPAHGVTRYEIAGSIAERRQGVAWDGDLALPPGGLLHNLAVAVAAADALPAMIEAAVDTGSWVEPLSPELAVFGAVVEKAALARDVAQRRANGIGLRK